jgi:hypothetical protein
MAAQDEVHKAARAIFAASALYPQRGGSQRFGLAKAQP